METEYTLSREDHTILASIIAERLTEEADHTELAGFYAGIQDLDLDTVNTLAARGVITATELEEFYFDYHYDVYCDECEPEEVIQLAIEMGVINSLEEYLADEDHPLTG
jgi:hypothetical protein